ncbi:hypothetical protein LTR91_018128 [Friedmanniomyces endolithicus]|uniref:Cwf19-like C-terminal domain-containing protein n=1 Tax=Friedmanniomyces endolithicus TaxID=329885 RepID=A0AAN6HFG7_9PEZI|nr:hypothetical protein LTR57_018219 [Friedmanniomyces endolithicus]KAK0954642.1 hypothetical protein LTS01_023809 [Friedmanniomyces endolithicus]KAK0965165.1 hypothetical protein LTR91_018128 [Friedmanniomyces endolithicus]KAK1024257.1 hypothetical protein LTS16_024190 [Friedmanniomyces endolithicus]
MASKIVVIGAVKGKFSDMFAKLATLHAKQNFAFAIIAGDLCANADIATDADREELAKLLRGDITVPLSTYFALGGQSLPIEVGGILDKNEGELCPNLSVLERRASIKTSDGFRIVAIGGAHAGSGDQVIAQYAAYYTDSDAQAVGKGLTNADIVVTSDWPAHIRDGGKSQYTVACPAETESIAELCTSLKPRYHFSASEAFYEREPFFHNGPTPRPVTRFISLAPFGNTAKQKWIYAFSLEPSADAPQNLPPGCTASPLTSIKKRKLDSQESDFNTFRYANGNGTDHYQPDYRRQKRSRNNPPPTPSQCYFCLSNPTCEKHMIGSIGSDVYLTTAKGPLSTRQTFPDLGFPGHILLIPVQHQPTISAMTPVETRNSIVTEMQQYRAALQSMLVEKSKGEDGLAKLGAVTWEISRNSGVHLHWQFLPVPVDMVRQGLVEAGFDQEAANLNYPKFVKGFKETEEIEEGNFFKVTIWSEALRKEMVMPLDGDFRFDLQFGRRVLGKLLGLEQRTHWKDCGQTVAEETADAEVFKGVFKKFDFGLEEEEEL